MRPLFYDNNTSGHHSGYIAGIVAAAEERSLDFVVASVERPASLVDDRRWIPVANHPLRHVLANRRVLAGALRAAAGRADVLVDLYLDKSGWSVDVADRWPAVHVLHHAEQYAYRGRSVAGKARTAWLRRRLRQETRAGAGLVVHTSRTREIVGSLVPHHRLFQIGYPVNSLPNRPRTSVGAAPTALFVGAGRPEKGLDVLAEAMALLRAPCRLRIVGPQPPGLRADIARAWPGIEMTWLDEFVDDATLISAYADSDLAVLPYRASFGLHGGPSSVLLETLGAGLPVVTTSALADQLPPGYRGVEVADADSPSELAAALQRALERIDALTAVAGEAGPAFVEANHSYRSYLDRLLAAAGAG